MKKTILRSASLMMVLLIPSQAWAQDLELKVEPQVGIDQKLGEFVPLKDLRFFDEEGAEVAFDQFFDLPVVLTLVYFRCPGICTPVLNEVASAISKTKGMEPGIDYRLLTVSFEPKETPEMAKMKRENMIASVENKEVPLNAWRFFTGTQENITKLTNAMGFHYMLDENEADYIHMGTVMFISPDGKIVRYLEGLSINPADFKMAVLDAQKGLPRDIMQAVRKLCSTYDPASRSYVLQINRIILGITFLFVLIVGGTLMLSKKPQETVAELSDEADTTGVIS
jgi:protein SCO1